MVNNLKSSLIELVPNVSAPPLQTARIYGVLKHRILTCALLPGQRIVEKDICSELEISRTPLREALNRLVLEDLVILIPYRGYAVAPVTVDGFQHLCEMRRVVESGAAARAAERATPEDIEKLLSTAETIYTKGDRQTYENYLRANSMFHLTLVRCTGNPRLENIVMLAHDQHQRVLYLGLDFGIDGQASTNEHLEIVDAVRSRDSARAAALMEIHIEAGETQIIDALRAAGFQGERLSWRRRSEPAPSRKTL